MEIVFQGKIDDGWHVYGTDIADGGPTRAELTLEKQKPGTYKVTFSAEGYETQTQSVTVAAGKTATASASLKKNGRKNRQPWKKHEQMPRFCMPPVRNRESFIIESRL